MDQVYKDQGIDHKKFLIYIIIQEVLVDDKIE